MSTVLYIATAEGVVTVNNAGAEWAVSAHGIKQWDVNEIAVDPSVPNRVYAATRGDGVLRSDDYGETWSKPNRGKPGPGKVKCVTIDPHDPNTIYAGGEPIALWVTHDCGESWSSIDSVWDVPGIGAIDYPVPAVEPHIRDIVVDATDPKTLYVTLQVGYLIKTTDGGKTWKMLDNAVDADAHKLVSRKDRPQELYLSTGGHSHRLGEAPGRALYRSADGGENWTPMGLEFEQEYSIPMVSDPRNEDVLYSALAFGNPGQWRSRESGAMTALVRSTDGGETWQALEGTSEISRYYAEAIAIDPAAPDNVYVATRSGQIFASPDQGATWTNLGVEVPEVADLQVVND